jgi:alginate O-acetyltransferase complex protein AlgJ
MAHGIQKPNREATAKAEVGQTDISRPCAWALAAAFLLTLFAVPVAQHDHDIRARLRGRRDTAIPQCYDIFRSVPRAARTFARADRDLPGRVLAANQLLLRDIHRFEDELEDASVLKDALLPPTQWVQSRYLGVGNERAYCGRCRWLFYRPGIDYVTGPGFLEPRQLARRAASGTEWRPAPQPDPLPAIEQFAGQLAERDITLVLLPTPVKPVVHPERFAHGYKNDPRPLQNASYRSFLARLAARFPQRDAPRPGQPRVLVFDPAPILVRNKLDTERPQFLATDTHWRPDAMELVARELAAFLRRRVLLSERRVRYIRTTREVKGRGDVARMLKLPKDPVLYPEETVRIHPVFENGDRIWRADKSADVLLLGDSFTNVYSFDRMGWGFSAGLAEQLSACLGRPIDRIVRNDDGAHATRQILSRELAAGHDRLAGKSVVIWQFAVRELSVGDWRLLDLTLREPTPGRFLDLARGDDLVVSGTVAAITPVPRPDKVAYRDFLVTVHLVGVRGEGLPETASEAMVYLWGMRDKAWTAAARVRTDQHVRMRLRSWEARVGETPGLRSINRDEIEGFELEPPPVCWGELVAP